MATEIEAKMAVQNHDAVRDRLRDVGAKHVSDVEETNTFFDTPGNDLQKSDRGLRVRINHNTATNSQTCIVTVKGPRQPGAFKSREEAEVAVEDAGDASRVFELLGYQKQVSFQKRRQTWLLDGCHVELDELPYLGRFVEIEGPDEKTVTAVREKLQLSDRPPIKTGYISLLTTHLATHRIPGRDIRFSQ